MSSLLVKDSPRAAGLRTLTDDPAQSYTLPAWAYLDPKVYEQEKRKVFYRSWQYAGWVGEVAEPGQYITASVIDQSVIIIRDAAGELRGFHNVCQHRGHQLLTGCGRANTIVCPYHAWVYRNDGTLRNARGADTAPGFEHELFSLKPVNVEVVADKFVFFNLDLDAPPFIDQIGDLIEDLRREVPDFDQLQRVSANERSSDFAMFPLEANWKIVMDNFLECYHCQNAHRGLASDVIMTDYQNTVHGLWSKQKGPTRAEDGANILFWTIFPNITFVSRSGGRPRLIVGNFAVPDGPGRTVAGAHDLYRVPGDEDGVDLFPGWGPVGLEDKSICESVQRGLASLGYDTGRLVYDPLHGQVTEEAVHDFHRRLAELLELDLSAAGPTGG